MKKLKLLAIAFLGIAFVSIVSCKKGDTGPAGPAGAAGPDSVIHSTWIPLSMTLQVDANNDSSYTQSITALNITQEIIDSGVVLSYIENLFVNDGSIVDVSDYGGGYLDVTYNVGVINITSYFGDLSGAYYRYVIIPGSILATNSVLKGYTKQQLKSVDYATITKALGISTTKTTN
jgi:hypothetical protein